MARRIPREKRPAPRAPRAVPSAELRQRRGPRPPDHVVRALVSALEADLRTHRTRQDATVGSEDPAPGRPGRRWRAAIAAASVAIGRAARRGVVSALASVAAIGAGAAALAAARAPLPPPAGDWGADLTQAVETAIERHRAAPTTPGMVLTAAILVALVTSIIAGFVLREHSRLVEAIARAAGVRRYVWTTRRDERVRPLHVDLEGTVQRWDAPPLAGLPNFHGHPGEAAGPCRCTAFPVL